MGGMMKAAVWVLVVVVVAPPAEAAIDCGTVTSDLRPCFSYVTNKGPLRDGCCRGIRVLQAAARTTADRQSVCTCLKSLAGSPPHVNVARAATIPRQCGINNIPYPISLRVDCTRVR